MKYYKLVDKVPVECTLQEMEKMYVNRQNQLFKNEVGKYLVSTVFLGIDHNFSDIGPPLLFETMIFEGDYELIDYQTRCSTYDEAWEMHKEALEYAREQIK